MQLTSMGKEDQEIPIKQWLPKAAYPNFNSTLQANRMQERGTGSLPAMLIPDAKLLVMSITSPASIQLHSIMHTTTGR